MQKNVPAYNGTLRSHQVEVPTCISQCSGIRIFGRRLKSLVFSTDVAIIKNVNADAIIAVYPFTPQPIIAQAIINVSDVPVFVGVGGGVGVGAGVDVGLGVGSIPSSTRFPPPDGAEGVGLAEGVSEGFAEGLSAGFSDWLSEGLSEGSSDGLSEGLSEGSSDGLSEGFGEGFFDGSEALGSGVWLSEGGSEGSPAVSGFPPPQAARANTITPASSRARILCLMFVHLM